MNWDAMAAVGETVGALAVLLTLVYLAYQIRLNTQAQIRSNNWEIIKELKTVVRQFSSNKELAALTLRGFSELDSLDPVESYRFDCALYDWLAGFERALLDARDGHYPDEFVQTIKTAIAAYMRTAGGRAWWEQRRMWFTEPFAQAVDKIINDQKIDTRGAGPIAL